MKIIYPVTALNRAGKTRVLDNIKDLAGFVYDKRVGAEWYGTSDSYYKTGYLWLDHPSRFYCCQSYDWILRDDAGKPVDPTKLDTSSLPPRLHMGKWSIYSRENARKVANAIEKGLPIPGTGVRGRRAFRRSGNYCDCYMCTDDIAPKEKIYSKIHTAKNNAEENDYDLW